jgi:hypothetical protein
MANPEHLDLLQQGIDTWNTWRNGHQDIRPDLSETDLSYTDLSYADLHGADLSYATLNHANLRNIDLRHTQERYILEPLELFHSCWCLSEAFALQREMSNSSQLCLTHCTIMVRFILSWIMQ